MLKYKNRFYLKDSGQIPHGKQVMESKGGRRELGCKTMMQLQSRFRNLAIYIRYTRT